MFEEFFLFIKMTRVFFFKGRASGVGKEKKRRKEGGWEESHDIILKLGRLEKIA